LGAKQKKSLAGKGARTVQSVVLKLEFGQRGNDPQLGGQRSTGRAREIGIIGHVLDLDFYHFTITGVWFHAVPNI
jgi:hypothetical protein